MVAEAATGASDIVHELHWHNVEIELETAAAIAEPAPVVQAEVVPVSEPHSAFTHAVWSPGPDVPCATEAAAEDIWIIDLDALDAEPPAPSTAPAGLPLPAGAPALATPPQPTPPPVDASTVSEITAAVGAHLAIDIALEVEQRVKQQMATVMSKVYDDLLQRLGHDIAAELEAQLSPKISELVRDELRRKHLLD
ncbi:hypothetical protein [Jeongeupia sp. USM3]|uniref:hypothetical protein n=1 Tax=Jeongeupia sp. USM3 TaxID=1906741 RepID=UPI00089E00B9|nr:hypothetical protein [Jeongeupia sp. USM3]AOY00521.1 hypothetical protein BJP62_08755 [Jeongeupia sp. USM3]